MTRCHISLYSNLDTHDRGNLKPHTPRGLEKEGKA